MLLKHGENVGKMKVSSNINPKSLQFELLSTLVDDLGLELSLQVTDNNDIPVPGCNFDAHQRFHNPPKSQRGLCTVKERDSGNYGFLCANHGSQRVSLTITAQFCRYEAFVHSPRILMWNYIVLQREYCIHSPDPKLYEGTSPVSNIHAAHWSCI